MRYTRTRDTLSAHRQRLVLVAPYVAQVDFLTLPTRDRNLSQSSRDCYLYEAASSFLDYNLSKFLLY